MAWAIVYFLKRIPKLLRRGTPKKCSKTRNFKNEATATDQPKGSKKGGQEDEKADEGRILPQKI